jgi:hypothetical protein
MWPIRSNCPTIFSSLRRSTMPWFAPESARARGCAARTRSPRSWLSGVTKGRRLPDCGGGAVRPGDGDDQRALGDGQGRGGVDGLQNARDCQSRSRRGRQRSRRTRPRMPAQPGSARTPGGGRPSPPTAARRSRQGQNEQGRRRGGGHSGSTRPAVVSGGLACITGALMLARHWLPAFSRQKTPAAGEGPVPAPAAAAS